MEETEYAHPSEYDHQIVSTESAKCKCGQTHEEGDAIWGGVIAPSQIGGEYDPRETVERLHSVEMEYQEVNS